jgi:hypothetical protein
MSLQIRNVILIFYMYKDGEEMATDQTRASLF